MQPSESSVFAVFAIVSRAAASSAFARTSTTTARSSSSVVVSVFSLIFLWRHLDARSFG